MKATSFCRGILAAGGAALVCLACTNPLFENVQKLVDSPKNGHAVLPVFSPVSGSYSTDQSVVISTATSGAKIYYTMDGSTPTASSPVYTTPVPVTGPATSVTIRAFARAADYQDSPVASASYTVTYGQVATPTFSPVAGSYGADQSVVISCATAGAAIHYTIDGTTPTPTSPTYTTAVPVAGNGTNITVKAIGTMAGMVSSLVGSAVYTINYSQTSSPNFFPAAGTYSGSTPVTMSSATPGATIRYTTDGTTPTSTVGTVYTTTVVVAVSTTIKAIAYAAGFSDSTVSSAAYTLAVTLPTFSVPPGTYPTPQSVVIATTTPGALIRYTTDGSTPTATVGTPYAGPVVVPVSTTLRAIAYLAGWNDSPVMTAVYTLAVTAPSFSLPPGTYPAPQMVSISTPTPGALIRYTTDGSTPSSTVGTPYAGPVNVSVNMTLTAIAYEPGWTDSPTMTAPYSIMVATPMISPTGGRLGHAVPVTLSCSTPGATIVYTIDGTFPVESGGVITHGTLYTAPFTLPYGTTTVVAMAFLVGMLDSTNAPASFSEPVFLYVGSGAGSSVTALQLNLTTGIPSLVGTYGVGSQVQTVAADPAGRYLFSSANLPATTSAFAINSSTGVLASANSLPAGGTFTSAAVDATGQYLYSSTSGTFDVTGYSINQSTGAVTQVASATGPVTAGVAADPVAPYLYVALNSSGQVLAFSINTSTGQLNSIGAYTSAIGTSSVVVDPTGKFLYAGNPGSGSVSAFKINPDGTLTGNGSAAAGTPVALAVDPTGRFLYAADSGNNIYAFAINTGTGTLSLLAGSPYPDVTGPVSLSVEPSGQLLYVAHTGTTFLTIFRIDSGTGTLSGIGNYNVGVTQTSITSTGVAQ